MTEGDRTCQHCDRELPFEAAKDAHESLHEQNAWEEAYLGSWAEAAEDTEAGEYDGAYEPTPGGEGL